MTVRKSSSVSHPYRQSPLLKTWILVSHLRAHEKFTTFQLPKQAVPRSSIKTPRSAPTKRPLDHESCLHQRGQQFPRSMSATLNISLLLKPKSEKANHSTNSVAASSFIPAKRVSNAQAHPSESPAKKQPKWSPEEDAKIIKLRSNNIKWEDISKQLPGQSAISCRLHYQNYLERRSEWNEDRKE